MKSVDTNAGGTSGYTIKAGKNSGKVLGHIKKEIKKIQSQWGMGAPGNRTPLSNLILCFVLNNNQRLDLI